jgi:hypothetical protein
MLNKFLNCIPVKKWRHILDTFESFPLKAFQPQILNKCMYNSNNIFVDFMRKVKY